MTLAMITDKNMRISASARKGTNKKYQSFYQFILKQEINENTNMEVREYNEQEAKIMIMFLWNLNPNNKETKFTGVCNTTTYSIKKGILKYGNKGR